MTKKCFYEDLVYSWDTVLTVCFFYTHDYVKDNNRLSGTIYTELSLLSSLVDLSLGQ